MEIVKASFDDIHHVIPLVLKYYEEDRDDVEMTDDYIIQNVAAMLESDACAIITAIHEGEVIGVAGLSIGENYGQQVAQEMFWKVDQEHTKGKAGSLLLKALEEEALTMGAETFNVVALAGEHEKRVGNSYVSRGYQPVCSTYMKKLG